MNAKQVERIIKNDGWELKSQKGSHQQFVHPTKSGKVTIAIHGKREINMKKKIPIIIESVDEKGYWGRVYIEDNLIVDFSKTIEGLKKKMTKLVFDFHGLVGTKYAFEIQYDISGLFDDKKYLNASVVADRAGISRLMLRQYRSGYKFPTKEKLEKLELAIHEIGEELKTLKIATMD